MKTFASALLASSALGATALIDFSQTGTYYMTRDKTIGYDVMSLSLDNGASDATLATATLTTGKYGAVKYTFALSTTLSALTFTNVCTMWVASLTKSSGAAAANAAATTDMSMEQFACYKDGTSDTVDLKGLSCWAVGLHLATTPSATASGADAGGNRMYNVTVYNYKTASAFASSAHAIGNFAFTNGGVATNGLEKTTGGFGETGKWTGVYKQAHASLACNATSGTIIINSTSGASGTNKDWAAASPTATTISGTLPKVTIVLGATQLTSVETILTHVTASDSTLFQTNGPLWAGVMRSFDQSTPLMIFGFKLGISSSATASQFSLRSPTLAAAAAERWTTKDLANTAEATTVWSSTVGKPTGVTTAQAKLDLFVWDDLAAGNDITVRVQQTSVLTTAVTTTTTKSQLQQMTCLNFFTSGTSIQFLCFLADTLIAGNATSELGTNTIKHTVWWNTVAPTLTMYSSSGTTGANVK